MGTTGAAGHVAPIWTLRAAVLAAVLASLALSVWGAYAQLIPNPDAAPYLRAAEFFAEGRISEARDVFRWPFYSLCIAAVMLATGLPALLAVQVLNALLQVVTLLAFVALVARLSPGDRTFVLVALLVALFHPQLAELRPIVIRDQGFYPFLLLALYFFLRDHETPRPVFKLAAAAALGVAALFRIEALYFALLMPLFSAFERAQTARARRLAGLATLLAPLLLFGGYIAWFAGPIEAIVSGRPDLDFGEEVQKHFAAMRARVMQLQTEILPPFGRSRGLVAYIGIVFAIVIEAALRALTWPIAIVALLAFVPQRLMPDSAQRFVLWFGLWQFPLLLLFTFFTLYLDWRYAMAFALIFTIPVVYTLTHLLHAAVAGITAARLLLPALALLLLGAFAADVPRPNQNEFLRTAGEWTRDNLPADRRVFTNDSRIAYFSGRPFPAAIHYRMDIAPLPQDFARSHYAVLVIDDARPPPDWLTALTPREHLGEVARSGSRSVIVLRLR